MRRFLQAAAVVIMTAFLTAIGTAAGHAEDFKVGTWKTAQTIQPFFYQDFLSEQDTVKVYPFTNPADQKSALLAGSLDMCGTTLAHAIHSASMGQPVVLVAAMCNKCSALVVKKDAGIENVADLKGKKIGYVPGTMHEILLRETLTRNGLSPRTDVQLLRVDFFDMGLALSQGDIHAFLSGEPFPTLAEEKGYGTILSYPYYGDAIGDINAGLLVTRQFIDQHPDKVLRLVKAHALASRHLTAAPEDWLTRASDFGTAQSTLEKAAPNMELAWNMDAEFVQRTKALGQRMQDLGMIPRQPDYEQLFDLSFVQQVQADLHPHD
ncbi:MAG: ABC transporter substrate-binding protein [Desulfovermiculus sp.]|nr:ABC transporter substrate-binding protein [Desulfovermiculus sp.]